MFATTIGRRSATRPTTITTASTTRRSPDTSTTITRPRQAYWGRYEIGSKGEKKYSILAEKDRKKELKDIPESAFPEPAKMPKIPGAVDDVAMEPPPENVPKDKQ